MHLLRRKSNGNFGLTEFKGKDIPPHAILSHRWLLDSEEPTFKDLMEGTGERKSGYRKLRFCGEQAAKDGLDYFWADTCCFDKTSSAVLSESINSMFQYYREAAKCYVHLRDVSSANDRRPAWEVEFQGSDWFTRGWTLQELIAPPSVDFFSNECEWLGDKNSLEHHVSAVTDIPVRALRGDPLSSFSTAEWISWATKRTTSLDEDIAYCLMGIFDVHMPLIYCEGKQALNRLSEEIDKVSKRWLRRSLATILNYLLAANHNFLQEFLPRQDSYRCFGQVTGSKIFRHPRRMAKGPLSFATELKSPYDLLFQPYRGMALNMSNDGYRCYVCHTGKILQPHELMMHVEEKHTRKQVCD